MAAFIGEFIVEAVELIVLAGVAVGAVFCGKKLRDRSDAKKKARQTEESGGSVSTEK